MTCDALRRGAAGLASLPAGDPQRDAAYAHSGACPGCAAALREGERLLLLLDGLPELAVPPALLRRAARPVLDELGTPPDRLLPAIVAATAVLLAAAGRSPSGAPRDWIAFALLAAAAAAVAALARRGWVVLAAALAISALGSAVDAGAGPLVMAEGAKCVATEVAAAALPLLLAGALWRRAGSGAGAYAAAAAAGALAGQAALALNCHGPDSAAHVLVFHLGGVLLAAGLGAASGFPLRTSPA